MSTATRSCPACHTPLPDAAQFCMQCGRATPTDPGVPQRTAATGEFEVSKVKRALKDRYKVETILGEGGMATVYLAEDLKHRRKVAIKVMRPELAATLGADRFLREVEIAAQLSHPHILPVHDSGEADGILYYVMPHVEEGTLKDRLATEGQLPVEEALRLAREVAEALAYAQARGIMHRDIKPGNILLGSGHAQLADFGIARAIDRAGEAITRTGLAVGTPQYMSPEQAMGDKDVDGRADVYALGSVLYEMLAGEAPFTGPTARAIMTRSMTETPRSLTTSRAGLPPQVDATVAKALARSPADRYPNAAAFADALQTTQDAVRSGTFRAAVAPASAGPGPLTVWGLFAVGAVAMMAVVYGLMRRWNLAPWTLGLAFLLLAIGAGVLLLTARIERQRSAGQDVSGLRRFFTWRNATFGGVGALVFWAVTASILAARVPAAGAAASSGSRIAVIPFENQGAASDAYFADGISDEVRGKLAEINGITVTASTSAGQYRGSAKTPVQMAGELGVDYLLMGKVRWADSTGGHRRVQVVPELIDGRTGAMAWQQSFDNDVTDVFQVQSDIATQVAGALGAKLGAAEKSELGKRPTQNVAAYDMYLQAKAITAGDPGAQRRAAGLLEQAVALDSNFADAWANLSRAMSLVYTNGGRDPIAARRASEAMQRALALAPHGVSANLAAASYYRSVSIEPARADSSVAAALATDPNDANALGAAAASDLAHGRLSEAIAKLERARQLDPRSVNTLRSLAIGYLEARRYSDALAAGDAALSLAPTDLNTIEWQAMIHAAQGDMHGAQQVVQDALTRGVTTPELVAYFGGYQELSWMLTPAQRQLLYRLTPAAFDNDLGWWGQTMSTAHYLDGDAKAARAFADSGLAATRAQSAANPRDDQNHALYGLLLAYLGRAAEARTQADSAVVLSENVTAQPQYVWLQAVRIHLVLGDTAAALDGIERLLRSHYYITPGWLQVDPLFSPLRGNERFKALVAGSGS